MIKVKNYWTNIRLYSVLVIYPISLSLIIGGIYLLITGQKGLTDIITLITGAVASISVVYLAEQIRVAGELEQSKRSYEYFARYNNESFRETISDALAFIKDGSRSKDQRLDIISNRKNPKHKQTRSIVTLYFNFFEDMAIFYNRGLLNKELIRSFFKSISLTAYEDGKDCIERLKKDAGKLSFYTEWEKMNSDFQNHKISGEKQ
jgi:hypothetical protein